MAGSSSPEDSEPLFVLEPLPELSGVIDSFAASNPIFLLVSFGAVIYLLTKYEDPLKKLWTTSLGAIGVNFYVTDSMFYSMMVGGATHRWDGCQGGDASKGPQTFSLTLNIYLFKHSYVRTLQKHILSTKNN